jgi:glycogen debranching enzyme
VDEASVKQQYYISTESSPPDDRTRVLKYGKMFAVFNRHGDIETTGLKEQGLFFEGTRFLSQLELYLGNVRPLLLSSTIKQDNSLFTADLSNVDLARNGSVRIPRGTLHVVRTQFLWEDACYQKYEIFNYGLTSVDIPIQIVFAADFADIFEVRGVRRNKKGKFLPPVFDPGSVSLGYEGLDGKLRRTCLRWTPEPTKVSESSFEFAAHLEPRARTHFTVIVACEVGVEVQPHVFESAWNQSQTAHLSDCKISSSNHEFNQWVQRSQSDVQMMVLGNPEHHYPYAGVPWFSTVFGRDGLITALQYLWLDPTIAHGVLEYLASTQASEVSLQSEAEPGKILHEMRRGEMASLGEVPFAHYYGSVDSTPLFLMLADAYHLRTGDLEFIDKLWPNLERALHWINTYGDSDGDGFVEYSRRSPDGLVQQGWKDSHDSIFHADGSAAAAPIALCEVQGYVFAAKRGAARLAALLGKQEQADTLESEANELRTRFHKAFWCPDISTYAIALDGHKQSCRVRTSNAGHCLYTGIADPQVAHALAGQLLGQDFFSGWGIRTVARGEARYNPISYHNGSIWPHDNAIIAAGLGRYGFKHFAGSVLSGMFDSSKFMDLQRMPELFCGINRRAGEGPTLYPVACAPQAWAAGCIFMLIQACLGLSFNAARNQIHFDGAYLPEAIPQLWIRDLKLGNSSVDFYAERRTDMVRLQVLDKRGDLEIVMS